MTYQKGKEVKRNWEQVRLAAAFNGKSEAPLMEAVEDQTNPGRKNQLTQEQRKAAQMIRKGLEAIEK